MRAIVLLLLLSACAATPVRERSIVVAFPHERIDEVAGRAFGAKWLAEVDLRQRGTCALVLEWPIDFNDLKRWKAASAPTQEPAPPESPAPPETLPPPRPTVDALPRADWDSGWSLDFYGVTITRLDDRPALRVETRHGDWGGMDRIVAWLEAGGGVRELQPTRSR